MFRISFIFSCLFVFFVATAARAQLPEEKVGEVVPRDVREMYDRGLQYLANTQSEQGNWTDGEQGPGITGLALMAFLASGEDPNYGLYSGHVRKAIRSIITGQNASTGYFGQSMYHHGFAMLALAEAYGTVDDRNLWPAGQGKGRTIGQALELAVRAAVTSQKKNQFGGWRYSPDQNDADTSVSGAVFVGLLAARNAGIEVPDESIDKATAYYQSMTSSSGQVAFARRKDLPQFKACIGHLTQMIEQPAGGYPEYTRYYEAQALFQGDVAAWEKWNRQLVRDLKQLQQNDGGWQGQNGKTFGTAMSLLALALNYRFLPIYER